METFTGHPKLKKIYLIKNKISSFQGLSNLPELSELYLNENKLKTFVGMDAAQLKILVLRNNEVIILLKNSL